MVVKNHGFRVALVAAAALLVATTISIRPVGVVAFRARPPQRPGQFVDHRSVQQPRRRGQPGDASDRLELRLGESVAVQSGPGPIIGLNDAERLSDGLTLLAGTGVPRARRRRCQLRLRRQPRHRREPGRQDRLAVRPGRRHRLRAQRANVPVFAIQLPNRNIMIIDQGNNRVIEVERFSKQIVWSYGPTSGPGQLNNPNSAELLPNGHILIADENNNRVIEITRSRPHRLAVRQRNPQQHRCSSPPSPAGCRTATR